MIEGVSGPVCLKCRSIEGPCRTVGLTPKAYARVARLTAVVDTCRGQENVPWSQVSDFLPSQNPVDVDLDEQMSPILLF